MKIVLTKVVLLVLLSLSIVSCSTEESTAAPVDTTQANAKYDYTTDEIEVMNVINDYRQSIGLNRLEKIDYISIKSEEHNEYMISTGEMNHNYFQDRAESIMQVLGAESVSENLAYNYASAQSVLNAWLNSESHKKNIVGDYTHFGVSIRKNAEGKKYYTNMFIKK